MTAQRQWMVVGVVVLLLGAGVITATRMFSDDFAPVAIGSRAPDFQAVTLDRPPVLKTMADYRDRVVLLNIWATWCIPCRQEMPDIEAVHQALGDKGLAVVAVSIDQPGMEQAIRDFVKELGLTFEILHDSTMTFQTIYRTTGVPETFVIGRDGTIRKKWLGPENWNSPSNRRLLEQLISEGQ